MERQRHSCIANLLVCLGAAYAPAFATVTIQSMSPSAQSPQLLGSPITWTVTAKDTSPNSLTFQFSVASAGQAPVVVRDFNIGTLAGSSWTAQPFVWNTIAGEGAYKIQVIAKDFVSGESATQTASFTLNPRVSGTNVAVTGTSNPLVALFSTPACPLGNSVRVAFSTGANPASYTSWTPCNAATTMNFYVAGMLPSTAYTMYPQMLTNGNIINGTALPFTTGPLPLRLPPQHVLPVFSTIVPPSPGTDTADPVMLWGFTKTVVPAATDLAGRIIWYYSAGLDTLLTRVVAGGAILTMQDGPSWNSSNQVQQLLREIDLAGNTVRETNTGILSQQLVAMGATDGAPCGQAIKPPPVGAGCLDDIHHDAIRLPNGYTAFLAHIEKLYPPGTQGSTTGQPVDVLSEMLIVLDTNWQVVWYYDAFQHAGGAPELDINRPAPLRETCVAGHCQTKIFLSSVANDWTHANTIYYIASTGDFLVCLRDQDWVIKIDYKNGTGTGNILWRMGPSGDFTFNNIANDPWPWFSHQHQADFANNGAGPLTIFDNGNTRISRPPLGLGFGNSRGMALNVDEVNMQVTPVLSTDLGVFSRALGAAEMLSNGDYFFQPGIPAYGIEILPIAGALTGTQVLDVTSPSSSYRAFRLPDLYTPPTQY